MIKFSFTLSDVDAENLINMFNNAKTKSMQNAIKSLCQNNQSEADWHNDHADYIEQLKQKVIIGNYRI
jgi:hypothetical protein